MVKQGMMSLMFVLGLTSVGCVADGETPVDEAQTAEETSTTQSSLKEAGDIGVLYSTTICWSPSAGLYETPCGNVRESMPYGRRVDTRSLPQLKNCNFEYWTEVTHHATGHQGWVRNGALCF